MNEHGGFLRVPVAALEFDRATWAGIRAVGGLRNMATAKLKKFAAGFDGASGPVEKSRRDMAMPPGDR